MRYDFIEIGTSDFRTLAFEHDKTGIIVEPVKVYIDNIPARDGLIKINGAIIPQKSSELLEVYYCDPNVIERNQLPQWLKGCNSINKPHPTVELLYADVLDLVLVQKIATVDFQTLFNDLDVQEVDLLKIDTEGMDADLMISLFEIPRFKERYTLNQIRYESNHLNDADKLRHVEQLARNNGYKISREVNRGTPETILTL